MSYQFSSSCSVWGLMQCFFNVSSSIVLVSLVGMLGYRFFMSNDANLKCGAHGVSPIFWISSLVFFRLNVFCSGVSWWILSLNNLANLYAGAWRQFTMGLMGCPGLCILIRPFMDGGAGLN